MFNRAESFSYSGASPVTAYFNLLVGPAPDDGNHAFTRNSFELGMGYKGLEISFIHRNDQNLDFSDGARVFAYRNKNGVSIPLDVDYDVDVWANQYQASGLKFLYTWQLADTVSFTAAYSHLQGTEIVAGYLGKNEQGEGGIIAYTAREVGGRRVRVLNGQLHTDIYYTDDPFFRREVDEPTGKGFAFDVGFEWQIKPNLILTGKVDDLRAKLYWRDIPRTIADATGGQFELNEDGFLVALSSFEGLETWGDYIQKLTRRERLFLDYVRGRHHWGYGFDHYKAKDFHRLVYAYKRDSGWGGKFSIETTTAAVEMTLLMPAGYLSFTTDETSIKNARTLGITWGVNIAL